MVRTKRKRSGTCSNGDDGDDDDDDDDDEVDGYDEEADNNAIMTMTVAVP